MKRGLRIAAALALALPSAAAAQSAAPSFSGRYRLVITVGRGCPAAMQVGPQGVVVDVVQSAVTSGSEVSGQSASPSETSDDGRFVLLRKADRLHGPSGAIGASSGLRTLQGFRVWMQIMADGAAATTGGRARASGTAFGEIKLSRPADSEADSIGSCQALDHQWALEPY
jgi:hypothetical protein